MDIKKELETITVDVANHVTTHGFSAQVLDWVREKIQRAHDIGAGLVAKAEGLVETIENEVKDVEQKAETVVRKVRGK